MRSLCLVVACFVVGSVGIGNAEVGDGVVEDQSASATVENVEGTQEAAGVLVLEQEPSDLGLPEECTSPFEAGLGSIPIKKSECERCLVANCSGQSGNAWFDCWEEHCSEECGSIW
jgi:hypothetical protein